MREFSFTVTKEDEGASIKGLLKRHFDFSSRLFAKLKTQKRVLLNDQPLEGWMNPREGDVIRALMALPEGRDVIRLPAEKDVTDSEAAIDLAISRGFRDITLLGGLGGRLDHTLGNLGMLAKYCGKVKRLVISDSRNYVFMMIPGVITIPKNDYKYLGIIAYGGPAENVTLSGVKYPLDHHLLTDHTTLGVSNEITASEACIEFTKGKLLVILSSDVDKQCQL